MHQIARIAADIARFAGPSYFDLKNPGSGL